MVIYGLMPLAHVTKTSDMFVLMMWITDIENPFVTLQTLETGWQYVIYSVALILHAWHPCSTHAYILSYLVTIQMCHKYDYVCIVAVNSNCSRSYKKHTLIFFSESSVNSHTC